MDDCILFDIQSSKKNGNKSFYWFADPLQKMQKWIAHIFVFSYADMDESHEPADDKTIRNLILSMRGPLMSSHCLRVCLSFELRIAATFSGC